MPARTPKEDDTKRIHDIFSFLLASSPLIKEHREALNRRGFSDKDIKTLQYASLPRSRADLVERMARKFGSLTGVPGFWRREDGVWELAGKSGILIPIRDRAGLIRGMKVRVDKPSSPSSKYLLLSSNPKKDGDEGKAKYPGGTAAQVLPNFPLARDKSKILRFTEGEIKADLASGMIEGYTVSLPGVALWRLALDVARELKPDVVKIAFDSDKDKPTNVEGQNDKAYHGRDGDGEDEEGSGNPWATAPGKDDYAVGKALASLYLALREAGFKVVIEDWPESAGKGIDDVLAAGATDLIREMPEDEADAFCREMLTAELPDDWVYVIGTKRFIHVSTLIELDKEQFCDRYAHETKGNPALKALSNPAFPKRDLPIYMPAREMIYEADGKRYFNLWRAHNLAEQKGTVAPFLEHVAYLIPDKKEREILLDWMAFCVQNPGEKIHWAILLQGIQGTGKSYLGTVMKLLLGPANVSSPTNDVVHEPYTHWQKNAQLIIVEELMARGRLDLMNKFKPMITQPTTMIREMQKPAYEQPNVFNLLFFTNHEDAVILDETDRRYCVIFSPAVPRDTAYYRELWQWTEAHAGRILAFFRARSLANFEPKGHAPMTAGKRVVIVGSMAPLQQWMADALESEAWPFHGDLVSTIHLMDCLPPGLRNASMQAVGKSLKAIGAIPLGQVPLDYGTKARVLAIRRHEIWQSASREAIAAEYQKWSASGQPGGNPLAEARPI